MNVVYAAEFRKQLRKLPAAYQDIYDKQEAIFKLDWHAPRLHLKKLKGSPFFSFRVTRNYRVLFLFSQTDTALFATIADRKDVYRR